MILVDAHADLAWNMATFGRDYRMSAAERRSAESGTEIPLWVGNSMLGWQNWVDGRVALIFATLFAAPLRRKAGEWDTQCYADTAAAHRLYSLQLDSYHRLMDESPRHFALILDRSDLSGLLARWQGDPPEAARVGVIILMEGADGVRSPEELEHWQQRGVRIVAPAWAGTRYAGGTGEPGPFTREGLQLLEVMADLGLILDLSHLAEQACLQALDRFGGKIIASHSNPRALLPRSSFPDRHLSDRVIQLTAERGGVIGTVVGNRFLKDGWVASDGRQQVGMDRVAAVINHVCQVVGDAAHVGLGSDFDGGFGLESTPGELDSVADLRLIGPALSAQGFTQEQVDAVLGGNWLRLLEQALPEA